MKLKTLKPIKRINLQKEIRISIITLLAILIMASSYTAFAAYEKPTTIEETIPTYAYTHNGYYDYEITIMNNSLYGATILSPGDGTFFKKLIENINMTYTYNYQATKTSTIKGTYKVTATIQTSLWVKEFTIIPTTSFENTGVQAGFTTNFPLNLTFYENFIATISEETGTSASEQTLIIKCTVLLDAESADGTVNEVFSPSIQMPLGTNVVEIDGVLTTTQNGALEETTQVEQTHVETERTTWTSSSLLFLIILIIFTLVTKTEKDSETMKTQQLKKIAKKYGEWIVETNDLQPDTNYLENVTLNSFDDLIKISEEIGKPIIKFTDDQDVQIFCVYDENIKYSYKLTFQEEHKGRKQWWKKNQ